MLKTYLQSCLVGLTLMSSAPFALADQPPITVGFAVAFSGWEEAYDGEATKMAKLWIEQTNAKGGLLGRQIRVVEADTKSDRVEGAKAGQKMVGEGADVIFVTADYDYGAPAALQAQKAGKISVFLAASDPKAGILGVGPLSFTTTTAGQLEGATMANWGSSKKGFKKGYVLTDDMLEYNKSVCAGYDWQFQKDGGTIVGRDTFKNQDASISAQVTRLAEAVKTGEVDNVMLCSVTPGGSSAIRQIRNAGINVPILSGSGLDGTYWLNAVPDLKDFYVPVQAVAAGDPRPQVETLTEAYQKRYSTRPSTQYAYPVYSWLELWAKAVTSAGNTDAKAVTAELEKFKDEPTSLGPRTLTSKSHIQTFIPLYIAEIRDGKEQPVEEWKTNEDIPMQVLYRMKAKN